MRPILSVVVILWSLAASSAHADKPNPDKVLLKRDFGDIRREVETLRGKKYLRTVPVYRISRKELRAITDRETGKTLPGEKLHGYEELLAWLDMVPPQTDLKKAYERFCEDEVDGFYVSEDKDICIPSFSTFTTNAPQKSPGNTLGPETDGIVLAHEFTHALEDQYWPLDDPKDNDDKLSTDRGTAHQFIAEGSATREMLEAVPDQFAGGVPYFYFGMWNALHSGFGEAVQRKVFRDFWKNPSVIVPGVPETLARSESMPYSFGYCFCAGVMRQWGLDGLDYFYNHPLVSSTEVMHPKKAWAWRDYPLQIKMPDKLPPAWKLISEDCEGESDIAVLFGCQFTNLNRGLEIARGWNGDHVALYQIPSGHRLMIWASAWDSRYDAGLFQTSWVKERQLFHRATVTSKNYRTFYWESLDDRVGCAIRHGKQVVVIETDDRNQITHAGSYAKDVTFKEPPEVAVRAAANPAWRRFNPFWASHVDGDYKVTESLGGLLTRHDRNSVGVADRYLGGALGEWRQTKSFHQWQIGGGMLVSHEAEDRRGFTKTTLLPWGVLASHCAARLPHAPDKIISRSSILWGLAGSLSVNGNGRHALNVLPFGLLYRQTWDAGHATVRLLGIPLRKTSAVHGVN